MSNRKKELHQRVDHTEFDVETGEIRRISTDQFIGYVEAEPDYIKIYVNTQLCLMNLDPSLAPVIIAFGKHMTYANAEEKQVVQTTEIVRESVAAQLGVTVKRVDQLIRKLIDTSIFIPMYKRTEVNGVITEKKRRGVYFVNPNIVGKGSWKDIKGLQQEIDYVKGTTSSVIEDSTGRRTVQVALPFNRQLTLKDMQEQEGANV